MKRVGNLISKIADMDNLYHAWFKASKSKTSKKDVIEYSKNLDCNLELQRNQILSGSIDIGNYHYFNIYEPKKRKICAAAFHERVLHHAIMNVCHQYFDKHLINETYATRKNKGTYSAIEKAKQNSKKYKWFAKLDVRKYFDSINHAILKNQLQLVYKDNQLLALLYKIIDSYYTQDSCGLPIGNLTSQYFANQYLSPADHFIFEQLKVLSYIRYMDDMVLFHNNRSKLISITQHFINYLRQNLQLEVKSPIIRNINQGLPFLGYIIFPHTVQLAQKSRKRFKTKFNLYEKRLKTECWSQQQYQIHVLPLLSFVCYADSINFRKKCLATL